MNLHALSLALLCSTIGTMRAMDSKAVINQVDDEGRTPLHALTYSRSFTNEQQRIDLVKKFILRGASINQQDHKGVTPLSFAVVNKQPAVLIDALCTLGADMQIGTFQKRAPLLVACELGCVEQIEALLNHIPVLQSQTVATPPATPVVAQETVTATPTTNPEIVPANS